MAHGMSGDIVTLDFTDSNRHLFYEGVEGPAIALFLRDTRLTTQEWCDAPMEQRMGYRREAYEMLQGTGFIGGPDWRLPPL